MTTLKYTKKPITIEAFRLPMMPVYYKSNDDYEDAVKSYYDWCDNVGFESTIVRENGCVIIATLEGLMTASPGDWIIKGVKGEFYPCKPDIFEETYSPVNPNEYK